jgi:hypothetical protein
VFEKFGKGLVYFFTYKATREQYEKQDSNNQSYQDHDFLIVRMNEYLSMTHKSYISAPAQDPELYVTKMGIALVHKENAWLRENVSKNRKLEEISIHCAISEFRHAKYIAEDRNDRNNLRWLSSKLQELSRNLQDLDRDLPDGERSW